LTDFDRIVLSSQICWGHSALGIESFETVAGRGCMNYIEGLESCRGPETWSGTCSSELGQTVLGDLGWSCLKSVYFI